MRLLCHRLTPAVVCAFAVLVGCAADAESSAGGGCIADHPPGIPFDVGNVDFASPAPGSGAAAAVPPSAATIAAECSSNGGTGCDAAAFISRDAASCIAAESGFAPGLEPWSIALGYNSLYERVVWNVTSKLSDRGADGYTGEFLAIDATEGRVLGTSPYSAIP